MIMPKRPERRATPRRTTVRSEIAALRQRSEEILTHLDDLARRIEHIETRKPSTAKPKK